ncbi:tetratricopeptide repeat protein [Ferrimonas balearica]|uniref:tetratricopeptide repeat protein n=1 Tax=Ferrimonas balearica TaxID=44012 RepID=UPI0028F6D071|nr:tetratricopeptide repeat protein [Ferrimonas balearica]
MVLLCPGAVLADVPGVASDAAGYATEGTCDRCHQQQANAWQGSDHSWAMRPAQPANVLGDFEGAKFEEAGVSARFHRSEQRYLVTLKGPDEPEATWEVAYTFGHRPLQQYLVTRPGGRLQALTLAWDSRDKAAGGQRWFSLYPGQSFSVDDPLHWQGRYQNWNAMCADCHSTHLQKGYQPDTDQFATTWQELSVGCQSCHGAGQRHIDWAEGRLPDASDAPGLPVALGALSGQQLAQQCARCHSRRQMLGVGHQMGEPLLNVALPALLTEGFYYPDGQIQGEVYVYGSFSQSRMHQMGVTCTDCHDPHSGQLKQQGNALCTQCHGSRPDPRFVSLRPGSYDSEAHHHHPSGSEGALCVNCHMPETTYMVVDPRRDHSFLIPRPDDRGETGSPDPCTDCHQEMSPGDASEWIVRWFEKGERRRSERPHWGPAFNAARSGDPDALALLIELVTDQTQPEPVRATAVASLPLYGNDALPHLEAALRDPSASVRAAAVPIFAEAPEAVKVRLLLSLLDDPMLAVRDEALKALAGTSPQGLGEAQPRFAQQLEAYHQRLRQNADLPGNRLNLAVLEARMGDVEGAIGHYEAALNMDPYFFPARVNLVTLLSQQGSVDRVRAVLDQGLALDDIAPADRAQLAYLRGLAAAQSGELEQANRWLEQAIALQPDHLRSHYNRALILDRLGRKEEALGALQQGLRLAPQAPDLLYASVYLNATLGNLPQALSDLATLRQLRPDDPQLERLESQLRGQ